MKVEVGDVVYDGSLGRNGLIVDKGPWRPPTHAGRRYRGFSNWVVLYDDGNFDIAFDNELEVINASR
jgi:hypothetical protein